MKCPNGHEMVAVSLKAVRNCKGCDEQTGTLYNCPEGCYGKCPNCAVQLQGELADEAVDGTKDGD